MKKSLALIFFLTLGLSCFGQNAFYEAKELTKISPVDLQNILDASTPVGTIGGADYVHLSDHEEAVVNDYMLFFANRLDPAIRVLDFVALQSAIKKYNDYVEVQAKLELLRTPAPPGGRLMLFTPGVSSFLSLIPALGKSGGGLTPEQQTNIIDGITKYYAEEFKKAKTLTYMELFEASIRRVGELEVLFPETYRKLLTADPSRFPELGHEYKTIFNEDLKAAIDNVIKHIDTHTAAGNPTLEARLTWLTAANVQSIRTHPVYPSTKIIMEVGSKLVNGYHPADVISFIDEKYYVNTLVTSNARPEEKLKLIFHGINLVQKNLLDTSKVKSDQFSNIWISLQDLNTMNLAEWENFMGLVYQQDRTFFDTFFLAPAGLTSASTLPLRINAIKKKMYESLSILLEINDLRNQMKDQNVEANFIKYMQFMIRTIETTNYFPAAQYPQLVQFVRTADYAMNLYDNARKKDYSNTAYYLIRLVNEFLPATMANYRATIADVEKYSAFAADIINAENSDEVKEMIKKHVAPPTSFILKREFRTTGSFTGHPGYFIGSERLRTDNAKSQFVSGITLPIGFEVTFKTRRSLDNASSIGIFAQLVDLGAVLNFRTGDETSTLPDKIEFAQVFSPGASVTYGFKNSPVTLGLGYQYTPQLRKITEDGNELYPKGNRWFLRVGWDIPMINVFKSRNK